MNLLPYFNGMLASSNRGGSAGVSVNFLDDGGAAPLMKNMPAANSTSNQLYDVSYFHFETQQLTIPSKLLTHLYQFFGVLLECSAYGEMGFPSYMGQASMYKVHKSVPPVLHSSSLTDFNSSRLRFMDLDPYEVGYFIEQVGLAATSFGVTTEDATAVGMALTKLFDYRCSPPTTVVKAQGPQLQSICQDESCPLDPNSMCGLEDNNGTAVMPMNASAPPSTFTGGAAKMGVATFAILGAGLSALML